MTDFSRSWNRIEEQPHFKRRKYILEKYPEIKKLAGYDSNTSYISFVLVIVQLLIAWAIGKTFQANWIGFLTFFGVAYCIGGVINHWLAMAIHECCHFLSASTPNRNRWVAIIANIPNIFPGAISFCRYHMEHHSHLGIPKKDNDLPGKFEKLVAGNSPIRKTFWLLLFLPFSALCRGFVNPLSKWEKINWAVQLPMNILIWIFIGKVGFLYLVASTILGMGLHPVAGHWLHEHYSFTKDGQETYSYYGPLNWVTFNVGYHNEHHDIMNVPGSRLPKLRKIAAAEYGSLVAHNSWTKIILWFIFDKKMSHDSRIVRPITQEIG